ncbi:MAG TPA: HlyC/CorC family transporter [Polyangiaceae bacterium]|nr:HlyC/CorC family transporter [Polyangiaceae bacterium]
MAYALATADPGRTAEPEMDEPEQPSDVLAKHDAGASTMLVAQDPLPLEAADEGGGAGALIVFVLAVGSALIFSFLCSIFESVLLSVSRGHVEAMARQGSRAGQILKGWKRHDIEVPIAAILILNTIAHTVGATMAGSSYEKVFDPATVGYFSAVFTLAILLFTEIIPKTLGVTFANRLSGPVTLAVWALVKVLTPILWVTNAISKQLTKGHNKPVTSIEEIRLLAALGKSEGAVGPRFAQFIEGVASLRELTVHDVMVPRVSIAYLAGNRTLEENLAIIQKSGHSRFPFTATGDLDDVDGIVLAKELLFLDRDSEEPLDWAEVKSPLVVVPEGKHLDEVLRLFQEQRKHMAVVVDEYGGTQGVVTLEDVLEEIVGEIEDETDRVERLIDKLPSGAYLCRGHAETRKLFKVVGIEDKPDFVTVGGLVADLLGHVPKVGDVAEYKKRLRFEVTKASKRRAERLLVTVMEEEAPPDKASRPPANKETT